MKTVQSEAEEICIYVDNSCDARTVAYESFLSGVEFAQRWISVEEELPNEMECVLLKSEYLGSINYDIGFLMRGKFKTKNGKPTHWRRIDLK